MVRLRFLRLGVSCVALVALALVALILVTLTLVALALVALVLVTLVLVAAVVHFCKAFDVEVTLKYLRRLSIVCTHVGKDSTAHFLKRFVQAFVSDRFKDIFFILTRFQSFFSLIQFFD